MSHSADLAIRFRRAAFNRALADANLAAIGALLAADVVLVTGTDSAVIAGRKAQLLVWKREFAAPARTVYVRTPETIVASEVEQIALEHGKWQGLPAGSSQPVAWGDYTAKWRESGGGWMLEAEVYLTLG